VKRRQAKGIKAWLVTWEGEDAASNGRCKVVSILPYRTPDRQIKFILPILFCSEYNLTLRGKMVLTEGPQDRQNWFVDFYKFPPHPKCLYGEHPHEYLLARMVKDLRCEDNTSNSCECTLHWTELRKYIPVAEGSAAKEDQPRMIKVGFELFTMIEDEMERSYTYLARME
jgi:hypothetical protein